MLSFMIFTFGGILLLGQIHFNSGEDLKEEEQIKPLQRADTIMHKYLNQEQSNSVQNNPSENCVFRVEDGDRLIGVKTRKEIEEKGLKIFDVICEGDLDINDDNDKGLSNGVLASLAGG